MSGEIPRRSAHDDNRLDERARSAAEHFVTGERAFHLGGLPTEQPHPYTEDLSEYAESDPPLGVAAVLSVDSDIVPVARRAVLSSGFDELVGELARVAAGESASDPGTRFSAGSRARDSRDEASPERDSGDEASPERVSGDEASPERVSRDMPGPERNSRQPRICFSGCGSTGRLAVQLEAMWREYFDGASGMSGECTSLADCACSIMTGGDRALIRAVEGFEDFQAFGARQVADLGLDAGDVLVAISEGGETSSVIGTAEEALRRKCRVYFIYNNPTRILTDTVERSRRLIENPGVTTLDLFTGPMALTGSTRMQATTIEMLVVGAAIEEAFEIAFGDSCRAPRDNSAVTGNPAGDATGSAEADPRGYRGRLQRVDSFARLLMSLRSDENTRAIAALAQREAELYRHGGRMTYFATEYLLDIFSDTTERSPTFMIPPFRAPRDTKSPVSWAFAKDPLRSTREAWRHMLRRPCRGIAWGSEEYRQMGAPQHLVDSPPQLDSREIESYAIGNEGDPTRGECLESMALWVDVEGSLLDCGVWPAEPGARPERFTSHALLTLRSAGTNASPGVKADDRREDEYGNRVTGSHVRYIVVADIAPSSIRLFHHLATKLLFNTFSTVTMALLGRISGNWMIQLDPTNKKLIDRGTRIIADLTGLDYATACFELHRSMLARGAALESDTPTDESPVAAALRSILERD